MKKILIAAPLSSELALLEKALQKQRFPFEVKTLILGVGEKRAVGTLAKFFHNFPDWDLVLCVGLSGALDASLKAGDVVTPASISNGRETFSLTYPPSEFSFHPVPFLTVPRILKATEKRASQQKDPSLRVVDMESFGVARYLEERGYPFQIVRSILDESDYVFPDFRWVFSQWDLREKFFFCLYAAAHPRMAGRYLGFRKTLQLALRQLVDSVLAGLRKSSENGMLADLKERRS